MYDNLTIARHQQINATVSNGCITSHRVSSSQFREDVVSRWFSGARVPAGGDRDGLARRGRSSTTGGGRGRGPGHGGHHYVRLL